MVKIWESMVEIWDAMVETWDAMVEIWEGHGFSRAAKPQDRRGL
jgi:hypothetical protein